MDVADPLIVHKINHPSKTKTELIDHNTVHGVILNISGSGLLAVLDKKLNINSYIAVTFELRGMEKVENILGKVKLLENLTCVFQKNDNQIFDWGAQSLFDLINHKYWHTSIKVLQKRLSAELIVQDGISRKNAERIVERELWGHLGTILITHFKKRHDRENIIIKKKENVLYTELLNPSFPFYSDFRTVYLSVISKLEKESCEEAAEIEML